MDSREYETAQAVVNAVKELGCRVLVSTLTVGDYVVSSEVAVERKRAMDFVNSIIDGRLFQQASNLIEAYQEPYIIIEGDLWSTVSVRGISRNALIGALVKVSRSGLRLIWTRDEWDTAQALYSLAVTSPGLIKISNRRKSESISDMQITLLSSLPGIGIRRAVRLLKIYGTPLNALNNYRQWPIKLSGLSSSSMLMIRRILESKFNNEDNA
ncbi:ERCC4 domain-containing protein [Caldivirga maquilingensis]|uniref:ERCC4 domain protein n=1 Tax=Caldivirga maquilingensis (strain ATCC 700844 / DSM 13496 / JCM 10307 / IC-167) TaxID=397948 RepID=A8MAF2_CALMQ|nr:ERCC4 domain-containing protein [Caldivirga maquilingensis]ABW02529.1 ERCC4 domain protein [Caldivirga maquilingensis IC-167]